MPGKTIKIISDQLNGRTPVYINGRGRDIAHNKDVAVTDAELEVLENSGVSYQVVGSASANAVKTAQDEASTGPSNERQQEPGGDNLQTAEPVDGAAIVTSGPDTDQEPGGDSLSGGVVHGGAADTSEAVAREEAREKAEASRDGTIEPVVELRNGDQAAVPLADAARADPLDHDKKDGKGGSLKGADSTAAKGAARKKTAKAAKPKAAKKA